MKKSPLQTTKDRFGDKQKLVAAVRALGEDVFIDRVSEDKDLDNVSNKKLLHLHDVLSAVKDQFGSRGGLIDAILKLEKRQKDEGYRSRLEGQPTPRLWDRFGAARRRHGAAE